VAASGSEFSLKTDVDSFAYASAIDHYSLSFVTQDLRLQKVRTENQ